MPSSLYPPPPALVVCSLIVNERLFDLGVDVVCGPNLDRIHNIRRYIRYTRWGKTQGVARHKVWLCWVKDRQAALSMGAPAPSREWRPAPLRWENNGVCLPWSGLGHSVLGRRRSSETPPSLSAVEGSRRPSAPADHPPSAAHWPPQPSPFCLHVGLLARVIRSNLAQSWEQVANVVTYQEMWVLHSLMSSSRQPNCSRGEECDVGSLGTWTKERWLWWWSCQWRIAEFTFLDQQECTCRCTLYALVGAHFMHFTLSTYSAVWLRWYMHQNMWMHRRNVHVKCFQVCGCLCMCLLSSHT